MEWREVPLSVLPDVPGMLGGEERQFLYWYARDKYTGAGEIVELGAFLGQSASALAAGLAANPRCTDKSGRVHSFDRFGYEKSTSIPIHSREKSSTIVKRRNLRP